MVFWVKIDQWIRYSVLKFVAILCYNIFQPHETIFYSEISLSISRFANYENCEVASPRRQYWFDVLLRYDVNFDWPDIDDCCAI